MAFCSNCGTALNEGAKFCATCGNAAAQTPPVQAQQAAPAAPKGAYQNTGGGQIPPPQQPYPQNTAYAQTPPEVKKLVKIATIVAVVIGIALYAVALIINFLIPRMRGWQVTPENKMEAIFVPLFFIAALIIISIIALFGVKKNKRALVLIAGVLYIYPFVIGIPSGILCILAFRKMPKRVK